jgi:hypothetical protein
LTHDSTIRVHTGWYRMEEGGVCGINLRHWTLNEMMYSE